MKSIFTSFSPNLEKSDAWLALKIFFRQTKWRKGQAIQKLESIFKEDVGMPYAASFESGRTALTTLLKTAPLTPGDEIALQAYTCVAVPNAVLWAGLKPVYVDCNRNSLTMSVKDLKEKITPRTKAVIVQHTFGTPANMKEIRKVAEQRGLLIIEDCAHVIGGQYAGRPLGSWGDASFFSFGRDKAISSVFGGVALVKDKEWGRRLKEMQETYPFPRRSWIAQQLVHPMISYTSKTLFDFLGIGKVIFFLAKKIKIISKEVERVERQGYRPSFVFRKMPNALAELALHQYTRIDIFNSHRKRITGEYLNFFEKDFIEHLSDTPDIFYLRFPLKLKDPWNLLKVARSHKIYLGDWYNAPIAPRGVDYPRIGYRPRSCPIAEEVAREAVNLPTDIHISLDDAKRIIGVVKEYLEKT